MMLSKIILENMRYAAYQIEHEIQKLTPLSKGTKLAIKNGRFVVDILMLTLPSCSNQNNNDSENNSNATDAFVVTAATTTLTVSQQQQVQSTTESMPLDSESTTERLTTDPVTTNAFERDPTNQAYDDVTTTSVYTTDKAVETAIAAAQADTEAARAATEAVQSANEMIEKLNSKFEQMQSELDGYKRRRILASSTAKKFAGSPPEKKTKETNHSKKLTLICTFNN